MQVPARPSTLATAAVLALAMALTVSAAMLAGGNCGQACSMGCRVALVADRSCEFAPASVNALDGDGDVGPPAPSVVTVATMPHAAPAAWRSLDMPPPVR